MPAPATFYSAEMTQITGNAGGQIQTLPRVTIVGSRKRNFVATIFLAAQPAGAVIGVARLPPGSIVTNIAAITDTSLGGAQVSFGDVNSPAMFGAAAPMTQPQQKVNFATAATCGQPLDGPNYSAFTGQISTTGEEDVVMTVTGAALPAQGLLRVVVDFAVD